MKIVIIEDEPLALQRLEKMLKRLKPNCDIVGRIDSVETGINWFETATQTFDLVIADIQLGDGLSLDIFNRIKLSQPVVFTTAHNNYALQAFDHLSIDYLLKPIGEEQLSKALLKFEKLQSAPATDYSLLTQFLNKLHDPYQKRLVVKSGNGLKAIEIDQISAFFVDERVCMLITHEGRISAVDQNLEQLEAILDPKKFFRINRKVIINVNAIQKMENYSRSRVFIQLNIELKSDLVVSTERATAFKKWLEG